MTSDLIQGQQQQDESDLPFIHIFLLKISEIQMS